MSISSPGIGSGIDVSALVNSLLAAEGAPKINRFDLNEATFQAEISAFGSLKGSLSAFQTAIQNLQELTDFQQRSATTSDASVFTVKADETADVSQYGIEVVQLAKAHKLITQDGHFSSSTDTIGSGTLKFTQDSSSFSLTIGATDTLEDVRDAINNATDNTGLKAAILNIDDGVGGTESKLVFTADNTGVDNAITITVDEDGNGLFNDAADLDASGLSRLINANLDTPSTALDGQIKIDEQLVSSSNNVFTGAIKGVTVTGVATGAGESLAVSLDKSSVKTKINTFISNYNTLVDTFTGLSAYDADTQTAGILLGDATLRSVQSAVRTKISSPVSGLTSSFSTLAEIGITTDSSGKLVLDDDDLDEVLDNNFDDLGQLFASTNGIANTLDTLVEGYVGSSGIIKSKTDGLTESIDSISEQREVLNRRLIALESRLLAQFTAMDTLVSSLRNQSSFLTQQLANLPGAYKPKS